MGTKERRQREAENRRKDILDAARKLFWENGFSGTSIPGIAREAELAPGTLYLYFPGKEALYVELLLEGYAILHARLAAAARRRGSPRNRALAVLDVFLGFAREYPAYYDIIFFLVQRERSGGWEGNFPGEAVARVRQVETACKAIAGEALSGLGVPPERLPETLEAVWSMLSGVIFHFGSDPGGKRVLDRARELLVTALAAEAAEGSGARSSSSER
ncbi:MAG: TetR/AcrR family transcriptional regulator [Acidobacteria bacterium]|nr:TetR/AcrR family transcriptional regulator [Acidobacteriota bacterium]